jgi:DNA modification methylase
MQLNEIICGDNVHVLAGFPDNSIDLTVTSPPYDNLRAYKGYAWDFQALAPQLYRVTKPGGVVVWVVADATVDGSETGTSFRHALGFMGVGFKLHDTMIYERENPIPQNQDRYEQSFEFMFILSKGKPSVFNPITTKAKKFGATRTLSKQRGADGALRQMTGYRVDYKEFKTLGNIWGYMTGHGLTTKDRFAHGHPAMFPEKLAEDHILSWSNPGDIVLDPFIGSGTTAKMAIRHNRRFIGIDISEEYCALARRRIAAVDVDMFAEVV